MMKVLFVAHSGSMSGGANRALLSLMCLLREKHGVLPSVLAPQDDAALLEECRKLDIPAYTGAFHSCCTVFQREPRDLLRLIKLFAAPVIDRIYAVRLNRSLPADFDLIYTNDRMVLIGGCLSRLRKIPHIWHVRAFGKEVKSFYPPFWGRLMNRYSDHVVAISRSVIDSLKSSIPDEKLHLIHDGLETDQYLELPKKPHETFNLLLTAHIVPHKGQMEALEALAILVQQHQIDAHLYLAGKKPAYGSQKYLQSLNAFAAQNGLEDRVHFLGQVGDMNELRSRMDAELECCWCEPFGRVTVEAMLSGVPVVGSAAGGTLDIIEDGVSGLLYKLHSPEDLAQKLMWINRNPHEAAQMALRGKERALQLFSLEHSVSQIANLIAAVEKKS